MPAQTKVKAQPVVAKPTAKKAEPPVKKPVKSMVKTPEPVKKPVKTPQSKAKAQPKEATPPAKKAVKRPSIEPEERGDVKKQKKEKDMPAKKKAVAEDDDVEGKVLKYNDFRKNFTMFICVAENGWLFSLEIARILISRFFFLF